MTDIDVNDFFRFSGWSFEEGDLVVCREIEVDYAGDYGNEKVFNGDLMVGLLLEISPWSINGQPMGTVWIDGERINGMIVRKFGEGDERYHVSRG